MARKVESAEIDENVDQGESIPESLKLARKLEEIEDEEELKEGLNTLLDKISQDVGSEFTSNVTNLYRSMQAEQCLLRAERLSRVLETVELNKPLHISDETETHYANAVLPDPEGVRLALGEGRAPGPVRVVVGFGKTLIGFKTDNILVSEIDFSQDDLRDAAERKRVCRHVSGDLNKEDIRYLVMRIPYALMDKSHMTEVELKKTRPFVFRGMQFPKENSEQ